MPVCRIRDRNVWEWIWDPFVVWVVGFGRGVERESGAVRVGFYNLVFDM